MGAIAAAIGPTTNPKSRRRLTRRCSGLASLAAELHSLGANRMEFRNTPSPSPISERDTPALIEDLCLALRSVGVWDESLPADPRAVAHVEMVVAIHSELAARDVPLSRHLTALSADTNWQAERLLEECLRFPAVVPRVREADGIRRILRCISCRTAEAPDRLGILICENCLSQAIQIATIGGTLSGFVVFRTYTPSVWCPHADAGTILLALDDYESLEPSWCIQCLKAEQERRTGHGA